jgi:hypothetical protein
MLPFRFCSLYITEVYTFLMGTKLGLLEELDWKK